jgi:transposase family protein
VIIDLTPVRDASGPARLLNVVEGRSKKAFKTWLAA